MLNYVVDADLLRSKVPAGTELDSFEGQNFVSLVGFQFLRTKVLGLTIPFHRHFDEVNLRFYVRRHAGGQVRRGVVFIREIVPRRAIAQIARVIYNENYVRLPMAHRIETGTAEYRWRIRANWNRSLSRPAAQARCPMTEAATNSSPSITGAMLLGFMERGQVNIIDMLEEQPKPYR